MLTSNPWPWLPCRCQSHGGHFLFNFNRSVGVFSMLTVAGFKQRKLVDAVKRTLPYWHLNNPAALEQLL